MAADRRKLVESYHGFADKRGFHVVSEHATPGIGWVARAPRERFDVRLEGVIEDVGIVLESRVFSSGARTHVVASAIQPVATTVRAMSRLAPDGLTRTDPSEVHVGDDVFDHAFIVEAPDRDAARRVLGTE